MVFEGIWKVTSWKWTALGNTTGRPDGALTFTRIVSGICIYTHEIKTESNDSNSSASITFQGSYRIRLKGRVYLAILSKPNNIIWSS